jgi:hypothetical protein
VFDHRFPPIVGHGVAQRCGHIPEWAASGFINTPNSVSTKPAAAHIWDEQRA